MNKNIKPCISTTLDAANWEAIDFFSREENEFRFIYDSVSRKLDLSPQSEEYARKIGIGIDPESDIARAVGQKFRKATPTHPVVKSELLLNVGGKAKSYGLIAKTLWSSGENPEYLGVMGRISEIGEKHLLDFKDDFSSPNGSPADVAEMMFWLRRVFDKVRLVDVKGHEIKITEDGKAVCERGKCYSVWDRDKRCENCVSALALKKKSQMVKLDLAGDKMYQVFARYLELDGMPCVMELLHEVNPEIIINASETDYMKNIAKYNRVLYRDPLTEAYNRRYYEEYVKDRIGSEHVAMIDCDSFKNINDKYGHAAGDDALRAIANVISALVGKDDIFIRYGGDEFVLVVRESRPGSFGGLLDLIFEAVKEIRIPDHPDLRLSVTIGALCSGDGTIDEKLVRADKLMYKGKNEGIGVVIL